MSAPVDLEEPTYGNYFVATYPPFYYWRADEVGDALAELENDDPREAARHLGLYVHVPFCVERCQFCYYMSYADRPEATVGYLDALVRELEQWSRRPVVAGRSLDFVYFGGGTPSLLSTAQLERLLAELGAVLPWDSAREVTFECAPRSVTASKLEALRAGGVTRLSMGVQQLDDDVLGQNGRVHLTADVERAWQLIAAVDFPVRNLDLMVGLAGETEASVDRSLARVLELGPESVTIYQQEIPYNTPLYRALRDDEAAAPASWEVKRDRLGRCFERLEAAGYTIRSAYAAVRDPARHRFVYQEEQYRGADLIAVGSSAFSNVAGVGLQNAAKLDDYLARVGAGEPAIERAIRLSADERVVRELALQLKLGRVDVAAVTARHGVDVEARFGATIDRLVAAGWLVRDDGDLVLTRAGLLRADRLLRLFYRPEHRSSRYS